MDLGNFIFLLMILVVGYAPYKYIQRVKPKGINDISKQTSLFLAIVFVIFSWILYSKLHNPITNMSSWVVFPLAITTILWFIAPLVIPKLGTRPEEIIKKKPLWFTVRFRPDTYYLKYFEVLFQQMQFIFLLQSVFIVLPLGQKILWFTIIVAIFHLFNVFFLPKAEAMIFFWFSIPMGIFFSYLIAEGFILLTLTIHLWFYLIFSSIPWFRRKKVASNAIFSKKVLSTDWSRKEENKAWKNI